MPGYGYAVLRFRGLYDAKNGDDVTLTIAATIQYYVEKYLAQAIKDYDVQNGGMCLAMNPKTGELLALASFGDYGSYDPNNYASLAPEVLTEIEQIEDEEARKQAVSDALNTLWRDKAISDTYEPGSVFKIITCATALEENIVKLDDTFYCGGSVDVVGRTKPVKCWKTQGHGSQTLVQAMQHSCNVALVNIGLKIGGDLFYDYLEAFGFFDKTGVDLPGESKPLWWSRQEFANPKNQSSLAATAFGQTFTITPIQLVSAVSAVVNGGYLMQPYVVKQITDTDGNVVLANEPTLSAKSSAPRRRRQCVIFWSRLSAARRARARTPLFPAIRSAAKRAPRWIQHSRRRQARRIIPSPSVVSRRWTILRSCSCCCWIIPPKNRAFL
jgi:stage V sporulation protein D (sporulation-specific penicillin-binding protein)